MSSFDEDKDVVGNRPRCMTSTGLLHYLYSTLLQHTERITVTDERKPTSEEIAEKLNYYTATTIPVHIDIDVKQTVVNLPEAESILRAASSIALGDCVCRKEGQNCDNPVHVCIALNRPLEKVKEDNASFHAATIDEALAALKLSHEAGLVHLAFRNKSGEINEFCSCCVCCCWFLGKLKQFDYHDGVAESSHIAKHLPDQCVACGLCVQKCPFDAWKAGDDGGKPVLMTEKCFGCGVCVTACPSQAIFFVPREGKPDKT
jgi:Na+-translocating ferredoxin:NAD+ oxidoreductase subunit B